MCKWQTPMCDYFDHVNLTIISLTSSGKRCGGIQSIGNQMEMQSTVYINHHSRLRYIFLFIPQLHWRLEVIFLMQSARLSTYIPCAPDKDIARFLLDCGTGSVWMSVQMSDLPASPAPLRKCTSGYKSIRRENQNCFIFDVFEAGCCIKEVNIYFPYK